jgi:DnaK suppressor protein
MEIKSQSVIAANNCCRSCRNHNEEKEMTEEEREKIMQLITSGIEELKKSIAEMEESTKPVSPDNAIGRLSRIDAMSSRMVSDAALRAMKSRLSKLEYLLGRIDKPDFGMCSMCGEPIAVKRLMVMPESSRCIHCADL